MRVLIIGYGSIAKKHIQALRTIDPFVNLFALRSSQNCLKENGIINIYKWSDIPSNIDFVIISNPTSEHYITIQKAIEFHIPLFIEKPPFANLRNTSELLEDVKRNNILTYTAFNFRFHPVIIWLKEYLKTKKVIEIQAYCGSYLPDWRPGQDYRSNYSSQKELGGGVHLDLIHEMDYFYYLFGSPDSVKSFFSKKSSLEINSVDCAHYWLEYKNMNVSILLNYYRRDSKRNLEIVLEDQTIMADLLSFTVTGSSDGILYEAEPDFTKTYYYQMEYFISCLASGIHPMNSLQDSIQTLKLCLSGTE